MREKVLILRVPELSNAKIWTEPLVSKLLKKLEISQVSLRKNKYAKKVT